MFLTLLLPGEGWSGSAPVILCLGDSLTAGLGLTQEESYPGLLQKRLQDRGYPHRVINAGVSGDTSSGVLHRLEWTLRSNPSLVILVIGANDGLRGLPLEQMENNIDRTLVHLQKKGIRVLLGGMRVPPNYGTDYTQAFAAVYPRLASKRGVPLLPFFLAGVAGQPPLNQPDGIHPNPEGYRIILENVWSILAGLLP
ncbi:MAG: arylesterase [Magnetococcales bacterium]|nr:arylesterase [Magnetococcales bacterium]MBF0322152.1 arylesterase [Magnetococcales bacterium]